MSDRRSIVDASEELGRKGQEVREMTRDLDLLKTDVDVIAMVVRLRGAGAPAEIKPDGRQDGEGDEDGT